jgi:N-formylglutamate deformylase
MPQAPLEGPPGEGADWVKVVAVVDAQFEIVEPQAAESPVVVEVPHAGLSIDAETLAYMQAPARSIARDADLYVDHLFQDAPREGATLIYARASRYVVDLNRGEADVDHEAVEGGGRGPWPRGLIWRLTTDGEAILSRRLPRGEMERRLNLVYRPYHGALERLLERKRTRFGFAILLCAHSMPGQGRRSPYDPSPVRADIVPGTRGRTTAAGLVIDVVDRHARARGWTVRHDDPYRGGFTTGHYGKPQSAVHAVQVEIARHLYMEETSLRLDNQGFSAVREFARTLAAKLSLVDDAALGLVRRGGASAS